MKRANVLPPLNAATLCIFGTTPNINKGYFENELRGNEATCAGGGVYLAINKHARVCSDIFLEKTTRQRNNRAFFSVCHFFFGRLVK